MALSKRSVLEIKIDILKAIQERAERQSEFVAPKAKRFIPRKEVSSTHVIYGANLSWKAFQKILPEMIECGLITNLKVRTSRYYALTPKGEEAIREFDELVKKISTATPDKPIDIMPY